MTCWSQFGPDQPWLESEVLIGSTAVDIRQTAAGGARRVLPFAEVVGVDEIEIQGATDHTIEIRGSGDPVTLRLPDAHLAAFMAGLASVDGVAEPSAEPDRRPSRRALLGFAAGGVLLLLIGAWFLSLRTEPELVASSSESAADRSSTSTTTTSTTTSTTTTSTTTSTTTTTTPPLRDLAGSAQVVTVLNRRAVRDGDGVVNDQPQCIPKDMEDLKAGAAVIAYDESDIIVGSGQINAVEWVNLSDTVVPARTDPMFPEPAYVYTEGDCLVTFSVPALPQRAFYSLAIAERPRVVVSTEQLSAQNWNVQLVLG